VRAYVPIFVSLFLGLLIAAIASQLAIEGLLALVRA
jgi:hypothetical protein